MRFKDRVLFRKKIVLKLSVIFVLLLFSTSIFSIVFSSSNIAEIDFTSPTSTHEYRNDTNAEIEVSTVSSADSSCFIDWNRSLVGYWNFEKMVSGKFTDNSTYSNNASLVNRYSQNITDGKFGNGFYFNGSSDQYRIQYLNCGNDNSLNITDEITIEAWIKEFETTFEKNFEDTSNYGDFALDVKQTSDGGYILTGETHETHGTGLGSEKSDLWLLKLDSNGVEEWNVSLDCNGGNETGYSVQQTNDGGYIIVGCAEEGSGDNEKDDLWLVKTNSTGYCGELDPDSTWSHTFGKQDYNDQGFSVQQTSPDNGFIITGRTKSYGSGGYDLWILKTDENGETVDMGGQFSEYKFNRTIGESTIDDIGKCVRQTSDGGYIIVGYTDKGVDDDILLIKVNRTGHTCNVGHHQGTDMFYYKLDTSGDDRGYSVEQTSDRGYIITGYTTSGGFGKNLWLIKTNETAQTSDFGTVESENKFNIYFDGGEDDFGYSVNQTIDGGYIITGCTGLEPDRDIWLIKTNETGYTTQGGIIDYQNNLFNLTWGDEFDDRAYSVQQTTDGGYVLAGVYKTGENEEHCDLYIIKTDAHGNVNNSNNNHNLNKTIVGKGGRSSSYNLELNTSMGLIIGSINIEDEDTIHISCEINPYNLSQQWNHIALTFDINEPSDSIKLYINGRLKSSSNIEATNITKNTRNLIIGKNFSGIIDEVRIWNRTLSHEEIYNSYNCNDSFIQSHQNLAESTYPYHAHIINSFGKENTTDSRNITIDTTSPLITVGPINSSTINSATITWTTNEETNATVEYGKTTSYNYDQSSDETIFETSHSETIIDLRSGQTYHYRVKSYDRSGNLVRSSDMTFATLSPSPGSDGDGDGDADADIDVIDDTDDNTTNTTTDTDDNTTDNNHTVHPDVTRNSNQTIIKTGNFSNGTRVSTNFTSLSSLSITRIKINAKNNFTNTSIEIKDNNNTLPDDNIPEPKKTDLPVDFKRKTDINNSKFKFRVYNYIDINFKENNSNIKNNIGNVTIEFKVKKTWIKNNLEIEDPDNYSSYKIYLMRYNNDSKKWNCLKTYINSSGKNNKTYLFFVAETPGFSTFAVVGSDIVQEGSTVKEDTQIPWSIIIGFIVVAIIILIVVLFKAGYIYFEKK